MKDEFQIISDKIKKSKSLFILTHRFPDGDTIGCAYAFCKAMLDMGKKAKVLCSDKIPDKFKFLQRNMLSADFEPDCIISVDVADPKLLGPNLEQYASKVDISIDHHLIHKKFAKVTLVKPDEAAACQVLYDLFQYMGISINQDIATSLYTGIATDTGCFKYKNANSKTHRIAAELIDCGADFRMVNRLMFETKTRERILLERLVLESLEFHCDNKCALICITESMKKQAGAGDEDVDGFASIPREIQEVQIGVTIREKSDKKYKISLRTNPPYNAAEICQKFGGGGHDAAAGCDIEGSLSEVKYAIIGEIEKYFNI